VKLSLSRYDEKKNIPWLDEQLAGKLRRIASTLEPSESGVDLIVVDDEYIRRMNRDYRGLDRATDVISFSYFDRNHTPSGEDDLVGEIYVSYQTLEEEARDQGLRPNTLFLRIGVHGLLHVLGFEHESQSDAEKMEEEERRLLQNHVSRSELEELF
jgi:probable rRNA maturation factor